MQSLNDRFVMLRHLAGGLSLQQLAEQLGTTPAQAESYRHAFLASVEAVTISEPPAQPDELAFSARNPTAPAPWGAAAQVALLSFVCGVLGLLALFAG